jgi:multiple sugar transport system substrate-binding protein
MKRQLLVVLVSLLMLTCSTGIVHGEPLDKVVVFVRTGVEADAIRAVAEAYTAKTGNPVEIMEAGRSGFYAAVHTQLLGGTDVFDLAQANDVDVGALAEAGVIAPIDPFLYDPAYTDLEDYDLDDFPFIYSYQGRVYALPFDVSTHFLYYRSDLIPEPPQTWDEYFAVAKQWTKSHNPESPTLFGTGFTALAGSEQPKVFYSFMWSKGGFILDEDNNVGVNTAGAVAAGEFYRSLAAKNLVAPDIYSWEFSNVLDALNTGVIAMAGPYWNAAYPQIKAGSSPYKDNIRITLVPGELQEDGTIYRTPFQQGKILLLNANSKHKAAAWEFYKYLTSKEGTLIMAQAGGTPARLSVLADPSMEPQEYYQMMRESLAIAKGQPAPPFYPELHEAMNQALSSILLGSSSAKDALELAARTIQQLVEEYH